MKKILVESSPIINQNKSGVGYYVEALINGLADTKLKKFFVAGFYFNFLKLNKVNVKISSSVNLRCIWLIPGKIISVCRRLGFQPFLEIFINTNVDYIIFTNYVSLPVLNKKTKKILVIYDLGFMDYPEYVQTVNLKYLNQFCPRSIKNADLIITISEFTKSRIYHHFPTTKAPIVVTTIPPPELDLKNKINHNILNSELITMGHYIFYIGTIEPRKNIQNLVKAYTLLDEDLRDYYSLVIAGGKGWKDEAIWKDINKYKSLGFNIITTGYVSDSEKELLYKNASCFVLASHYEGFGMPILEAMKHKIPVAVSNLPIFKEVADDAVLYFNKDDVCDISQKIKTLLKDTVVRQRLINKSQIQLKKYTWKNNIRKIINELGKIST